MSRRLNCAAVLLACASCAASAASDDVETQQIAALRDALGEPRYRLFAYGEGHHTRAYDIASHVFALDALRRADARIDVQAAIAAGLIEAQLRAGLDADALATFDGLTAPLRERMLHGEAVCASGNDPYVSIEFHPRIAGAGVAMALSLAGRDAQARDVLAALEPFVPFDGWDCDLGAPAATLPDCVAALVGAAPFDAYRWRFDGGCVAAGDGRSYLRTAEAGLAEGGVPEAWRIAIQPNDDPRLSDGSQEELDRAVAMDAAFAPAIDALKSQLSAIDARDATLIARYERWDDDRDIDYAENDAPPSDADRALAATLKQRISTALYDPYRSEPFARASAANQACDDGTLHCADVGGVRWELYVSQDLDPTGEVPAAGYWLRRRDGDAAHAYYLGIREHLPYVLASAPSLVLVDDGVLQLDMDVKAIDTRSITYPPMALAFEPGGAVRISAPIEAIVRDADGDGLTDLMEQRLLLDPRAVDSDGDGMDDGADPMPNVARRADASERSLMMAAALNALQRDGDHAISFGIAGSDHFVRRKTTSQLTTFLYTDPGAVSALEPDARVIVLPLSLDGKALRARPGFDVFHPLRIRLDHVDGADTATLTWSNRWSGGTLALFKRAGRWHAAVLSAWVT